MAADEWDEVGERVFRKRFDPCDVTVTAVLGATGVAVVDTRCSIAEAREVKDQLRKLTHTPVRWVVNTHAHFDHTWGNAEFVEPRQSPPATIWGHETLPARFDREDPTLAEHIAMLNTGGAQWRERVAALELVPPTRLVRDRAEIDLGDRVLELVHLGRGHTDGDLWLAVHAPGERITGEQSVDVLLAGDLIEQSGPPAYGPDSFPLEWAPTLDRALRMIGSGTAVIPGHGETVDAAFVRRQRSTIDAIAREIRRLHAAAVPVERAAKEGSWPLPVPELRSAITRGYAALSVSDA